MRILVTGAAGFIGFHLSKQLMEHGYSVVGLDNLNAYYDVSLKQDRLANLQDFPAFRFEQVDLMDSEALMALFETEQFTHGVNLAAQAGVPYSLENPRAYVDSNILGFLNVLEACRHFPVKHLIYASSSSVYGLNTQMPFNTDQSVGHPISIYAATKRSNELMAHSYSTLFDIPTTGLRFFTVYGPWGRPDMAIFRFVKSVMENRPIDVYNRGVSQRSYTYVDDVVEGIVRLLDHIPQPDPDWSSETPTAQSSSSPYRLYNIGNDQTVALEYLISVIEKALGRKAIRNYLPLRKGDVPSTYAGIEDLEQAVGYRPSTSIESGVEQFVRWYRAYYGV
ncbi:MAG: NAD-dependent epimerase [bacterium]|nr:NAD-dependent epimerase [bacterium]